MIGLFVRLRWQLILSHLAAIAFTLVSMVAAVVLIAGSWLGAQAGSLDEPAQEARVVARAIGGLLRRDDAAELNVVLRALARGDLRVLYPPGAFAPDRAPQAEWFGPSLRGLAYIVVVGRDGKLLASSEPAGADFAPPERPEWAALAQAALAEKRDSRQLTAARSGGGPAALGAYPVLDGRGQPGAAVVVATRTPLVPDRGSSFWRSLVFVSAASMGVLAAASVFALASASLVGYLLARRLVARLEALGRAAELLAAGDLSRRVAEGPPDEVGQLERRLNYMADRLASSVAELEAAKGRTEATLRAKRDLVANVSHELRTPLALIRSHVESLLMASGSAEGRQQGPYLAIIHRETQHLSRLIDDLFALSTAEAGALPLKVEAVSLAEVVDEVVGGIRAAAWSDRRVTVVTQVAADLAAVLADRQRVVQSLANLVRNAVRHSPEGGLISVSAVRREEKALVMVEDTGPGIPADQLPHVFERFYRGDAGRDRSGGGVGLGLAIVREFIQAMGGEVFAESTPGQGSRFSFTLPLVAGATAEAASLPAERT